MPTAYAVHEIDKIRKNTKLENKNSGSHLHVMVPIKLPKVGSVYTKGNT